MFKKILQFSLFVALATGLSLRNYSGESYESSESMEKTDGLCMGAEEVIGWCVAGTALGDKLGDAMMTCSNAGEPAGRRKGKGK